MRTTTTPSGNDARLAAAEAKLPIRALEFEADLAVLAREEKLHAHAPYCLPTQFL